MHVVPATWNIMAPAQPVEKNIFLIPRPSSKVASLQENFPEPLSAHFPLGVSRAFEGGGTLSQSPPAHTQLGVPCLGALGFSHGLETLWHCFLLHLLQTCPGLGLSRC